MNPNLLKRESNFFSPTCGNVEMEMLASVHHFGLDSKISQLSCTITSEFIFLKFFICDLIHSALPSRSYQPEFLQFSKQGEVDVKPRMHYISDLHMIIYLISDHVWDLNMEMYMIV